MKVVNKRRMLQITETLQTKRRTLQMKKEHNMRAHSAEETGANSSPDSPEPKGKVSFSRDFYCLPSFARFAMFCSGCGSRLLTAAKFCHGCGLTIGLKDNDSLCVAEVETDSSERKRHQSTPLTFEEYRERKGKE